MIKLIVLLAAFALAGCGSLNAIKSGEVPGTIIVTKATTSGIASIWSGSADICKITIYEPDKLRRVNASINREDCNVEIRDGEVRPEVAE